MSWTQISCCCWLLVVATAAMMALAGAAKTTTRPISCVNDAGEPVDWAIVYKFPTLRKQGHPYTTGWAYATLTSQDVHGAPKKRTRGRPSKQAADGEAAGELSWQVSPKLVNAPDSLVFKTLEPAYDRTRAQTLSSVFYSDQPPNMNKSNAGRGHAKGALLLDEQSATGLWLIHTVPKFPTPRSEPLSVPHNQRIYGQTFMCLSFNLNDAGQQIIRHLINLRPHVYDAHLSERVQQVWPETSQLQVDALKGKRLGGEGHPQLAQAISTRGGEQLALFSQSGEGAQDMFAWLNRELHSSLYVESWRNGVGSLRSSCPSNFFHVNNVEELKVEPAGGQARVHWSYRQDHSKWAISDSAQSGFVCMSDINRMVSQFKRGGGSVCLRCPQCWQLFSKSILQVEPCSLAGSEQVANLVEEDGDSDYDSGDDDYASDGMDLD